MWGTTEAAQPGRRRAGGRVSGAFGRAEVAVQLSPKGVRLGRVAHPGQPRRAARRLAEVPFQRVPVAGEVRALQQEALVQRPHHLQELLSAEEHPEPPADRLLDVLKGVPSVEQLQDGGGLGGHGHHHVAVMHGVAQAEARPARGWWPETPPPDAGGGTPGCRRWDHSSAYPSDPSPRLRRRSRPRADASPPGLVVMATTPPRIRLTRGTDPGTLRPPYRKHRHSLCLFRPPRRIFSVFGLILSFIPQRRTSHGLAHSGTRLV